VSDTSQRSGRTGPVAARVVALLGAAISAYLTIEHYMSSATLACPDTGAVNCLKVTTSRWSTMIGVPVAVLGLAFFVGMTALLLLPATRVVLALRVVGVTAGVAMVLYLVYVELFRVDAVCLWCTGVHLCALALFGLVLWNTLSDHSPARLGTAGRR
jgi:uncharacterized membrane protein